MSSSESLVETILALGTDDTSIHIQCQRMQSISHLLKSSRPQSHPERQIGAATKSVDVKVVTNSISGSSLLDICHKVPELASQAASQLPGCYFTFFFLSFMLDVLKALKTEKQSVADNSKPDDSRKFEDLTGLNISSVIFLKVLNLKFGDSDSPWIQNKSCCLKVNKFPRNSALLIMNINVMKSNRECSDPYWRALI